jgi:spermidine synthase
MIAALVAVFVFSGAAGLIYESLWSRYLGLFVGHSAYAQIIVLVIFLGGMSLGAHLAGQRSQRIRSPLIWYAIVELIVGVLSIVFHDLYLGVTAFAYDSVFPSVSGTSLVIVKWAIASLLILPQSVLLGSTFPLMSAGVIRLAKAGENPGRILALLYFANSIGAAAGVLLGGMVAIRAVGLPGTLLVAGFINVIAAAVVFLLARGHARWREPEGREGEQRESEQRESEQRESEQRESEQRESEQREGERREGELRPIVEAPAVQLPASPLPAPRLPVGSDHSRVLLWVAFGTAAASFIYEIAWIRMLSLVIGSATASFDLMLSAFILGLALGALWIRNRADTIEDPVRFLGYVQWVMGVLAVATLPLYLQSFDWMSTLLGTVASNENGYRTFTAFRYVISLLIMLPATFCAGMTLPLITRILMKSGAGERAIGTVYAVNTLGSIVGVVLAGLVLMPLLGLKRLLLFGAVVDIALGVWLVARTRPKAAESAKRPRWAPAESPIAMPLLLTGALLVGISVASPFELARITSGVYRHGIVDHSGSSEFPFYRDGRTATVSVERNPNGFLTLSTNGKPDASIEAAWLDSTPPTRRDVQLTRDIATQLLLPLISLAHNPEAKNIAVVGHGSGMTSHVLLGSAHATEVVTIEIEPEMVEAAKYFRPANRRVYEDRRSTFVIDDAKSYFASSGRQWDIILSEPSNPWVSGVAGLFTHEFYERVKRQLADDGVFGQWLHLYELNDGLVHSVLAAIDTVFPAYEVFYTSNADILVVAGKRPLRAPAWNVTEFPGIQTDMRRVVPFRPESFEALRLGGRDVLHPLLMTHGTPNSDFFPVLDLNAEKMRFLHENASGYTELSEGRFDIVAAISGRRQGFGTAAQSPTPEIARSAAVALGARLQALRTLPASVTRDIVRDTELGAAMHRVDQVEQSARGSRPPADWGAWMHSVVAADVDLHSGTAGVVDTAFYNAVRAYVTRAGAPVEARASLDFLHGIGAWNWPEAAAAAKLLLDSNSETPWLPSALLRNGAAAAFINVQDTAAAKQVLRTFAQRINEDRMRERIIGSYLISLDPEMRRQMGWTVTPDSR